MKIPRLSSYAGRAGRRRVFPAVFSAHADLKLAAIFGDNMVLQQQMTVPIWGWASSNADVTVKFAGQTKTARAGADGKWLVKLERIESVGRTARMLAIESGNKRS